MSRSPLKVGDEGFVLDGRRERTEAKVVKVGRRWAQLEPSWLPKVDIATGVADQDWGSPPVFYTAEHMEYRDRLQAANVTIAAAGLSFKFGGRSHWSDDDCFALAAWVEERFNASPGSTGREE